MDQSVEALIADLATDRAADAWRHFLKFYSTVLSRVVYRFEHAPDRRNECFVFVCNGLSDGNFKRLRAFQAGGPARFETWLMTVAANLCIDWQRREDGRARMPAPVRDLSNLEQRAFHLLFVRGLRRSECLERMRPEFPDLTEARLAELNAELFKRLSPRQRFVLSSRRSGRTHNDRLDDEASPLSGSSIRAAVQDGPEALSAHLQDVERLGTALERLSSSERLLLALRFEQGLTLAEVARIGGLGDPFRARRAIDAALTSLRLSLEPDSQPADVPQELPVRP